MSKIRTGLVSVSGMYSIHRVCSDAFITTLTRIRPCASAEHVVSALHSTFDTRRFAVLCVFEPVKYTFVMCSLNRESRMGTEDFNTDLFMDEFEKRCAIWQI